MKQVHSRSEKKALTIRLRKIKGQVRAIEKMVEADADCADTLMQVVSASRALKSFGEKVLTSHIHLYIESATSQSERHDNLRSLITVLERYVV
jgi:DNA-binding FrmR family transcriptional regulator